jgi:hypothetical protein
MFVLPQQVQNVAANFVVENQDGKSNILSYHWIFFIMPKTHHFDVASSWMKLKGVLHGLYKICARRQ